MSCVSADFSRVPDVCVDSEISEEKMLELYEKCKSVVWLLLFKSRDSGSGEDIKYTRSGFSTQEEGLVMTTSAAFLKDHVIHARRLADDFICRAAVECEIQGYNIALIRVDKVNDWNPCSFAPDGSLWAGQTLFHIGKCRYLVGSLLMGIVGFPCLNKYKKPVDKYRKIGTTPHYRVLGDVFPESDSRGRKNCFEARFDPRVQVIQLYNMVAGEGCQGGPLFNLKGEIVGMMLLKAVGNEIALHLDELKKFFRDREQNSKDVPTPSSQVKLKDDV